MITIIHLFRGEKMVELIKEELSFEDDKVTQDTFLSSIKSWYNDTGIHCGIEKVYVSEKEGQFGKYTLFTLKCSILDDMEKCRARVLDDNGKVVMEEDNMGNEVEKIEIISDPQEVTFFLFVNHDKEEDNILVCGRNSGLGEFIRPCFVSSGLIPSDHQGGVRFTEEELIEALDGYECFIKYGKNERAKKPHPVAVNL